MKNFRNGIACAALASLLCLGGCGTISFFPHASAVRAADKVLDDILPGNGVPDDSAKISEAKKP